MSDQNIDPLNRIIETNLDRPFVWGEWDCCLFAADCIRALTGEDPMAGFRGEYNSRQGALALIKAHPSRSLYNILRSRFGNPLATGRRGDLAYTVTADGPTLGVCVGAEVVFLTQDGMQAQPARNMRFFRYG